MNTIEHYYLIKTIVAYAALGLGSVLFLYWIAWNIVRDIRYKRIMKKIDDMRKKRS